MGAESRSFKFEKHERVWSMNWWKKWLSYLVPVHIETIESEYNEYLELYMINGRLRLTTYDAIYSYDDRYYNFYKTFSHSILPPHGSKVLILGLGLGSIVYLLENTFKKQYHYTAVEVDEAVLYLFGKYQQERLDSSIEIIGADAANFMLVQEQKYDLICIDIFIGEFVPSHIKENNFIKNIESALHPDGRILWNMLYDSEKHKEDVDQFIELHFSPFFPDYGTLEVLGNVMLTNRSWKK